MDMYRTAEEKARQTVADLREEVGKKCDVSELEGVATELNDEIRKLEEKIGANVGEKMKEIAEAEGR